MKGTTTIDTIAMRLSPPIITSPAHIVTTAPATIAATDMVHPNTVTPVAGSAGLNPGSKKRWTADDMPFTCARVPMPKSPVPMPKTANRMARGFHFSPSPRSM